MRPLRLPGLIASAALMAAALAAPARAYVGRWTTWTDLNPVLAMAEHKGRLYVGSTGGIRSLDPVRLSEVLYDNSNGLTDTRIVGFAEDADRRLWAVARSGLLYRLEGGSWSAWGRSYRSGGWTFNDRAVLAAGDYLVLGSTKGLTFFDRKRGVAAANLTLFGTSGAASVTGLARIGDTLFIADGARVLKAAVDFANPLSTRYGTLFDPQIWKPAAGILSPLDVPALAKRAASRSDDTLGPVDTVPAVDSAMGRPVHLALVGGRLMGHDTGMVLAGPPAVRAIKGRKLVVDGEAWPDSSYTVAHRAGGRLFLGNARALHVHAPGEAPRIVLAPRGWPGQPASITAREGRVYLHTMAAIWTLRKESWAVAANLDFFSVEQIANELRNVRLAPGGDLYSGEWGLGLRRTGPSGTAGWSSATDPDCLKSALTGIDYTVILTLDVRGNDLWMAVIAEAPGGTKPDHHWLAHLDLRSGAVSCPESRGRGYKSHSLRILRDDLFASAGESGIDLFTWGRADGRIVASPRASVRREGGEAVGRDAALDRHGRLWLLFSEQLGYVDKFDSLMDAGAVPLAFKVPENVPVKTCRDMETDPRGGLWIGCDNGLFHVRPQAGERDPEVERFTSDNGLASNRVLDVAVDPADGTVWAVTDGGISRLEGPAPPPAVGLSGARAYPNPFLARHRFLVLDHLPPKAEAAILTQSGSVVRRFRPDELRGNQYQWDGTNASGRAVKPGVYFYSVTADGKTERGKIIVAR